MTTDALELSTVVGRLASLNFTAGPGVPSSKMTARERTIGEIA
jgi:hypothetical protein